MTSEFLVIKGKITLYSTDKGGRKTPITSGYRPNHVFEYKENALLETYIGDVKFEEQKFLYPGDSITATVRFLRHGGIDRFIQIGRIWWIHEGKNKHGEAKILEII